MEILGLSSLAVAPSAALRHAVQPELCNFLHSVESPHPYGISVHIKDKKTGVEQEQPLYYVSKAVAAARGRDVREGWYLVARPNTTFFLSLTRISGEDTDKKVGETEHAVRVLVDGVNVFCRGGYYRFPQDNKKRKIIGFSKSFDKEGYPTEIQTFRFQRSQLSDSSKMATAAEPKESSNSCIQLEMFSGPLLPWKGFFLRQFDSRKKPHISEKVALKKGLSLSVGDGGKVVKAKGKTSKPKHYVNFNGSYDAILKVYYREQFWLESRCIVDKDGKVWRPKTDGPVVDIMDEPEDVHSGNGAASDKNHKVGEPDGVESKAKRTKKEVVDLTLVNDHIDLTVMDDQIIII